MCWIFVKTSHQVSYEQIWVRLLHKLLDFILCGSFIPHTSISNNVFSRQESSFNDLHLIKKSSQS